MNRDSRYLERYLASYFIYMYIYIVSLSIYRCTHTLFLLKINALGWWKGSSLLISSPVSKQVGYDCDSYFFNQEKFSEVYINQKGYQLHVHDRSPTDERDNHVIFCGPNEHKANHTTARAEVPSSPPVQLLHLLYGVGPLQHLGGRGRCRPLPRGGSVDVIHVEDSAVAVDARLPVYTTGMHGEGLEEEQRPWMWFMISSTGFPWHARNWG